MDDSDNFVAPGWFGREVTDDGDYKNQSLALQGAPKEAVESISNIPEYTLESGVDRLSGLIDIELSKKLGPILIEIAGGSASGKTSAVAMKIKEKYGDDAIIVSMDDYCRGNKFVEDEATKGNKLNWDQPEYLNLELLVKHLQTLKDGEQIEKPIFNFKTGEPDGSEVIQPHRIVIVEGLFALNDALTNEGDVKVFVDISTHGRILRRMLRDVDRTGQRPSDILRYFSEVVEPMHKKHIQSTKKNADIVIKNEYNPQIEASRAGMFELQLKFKADLDPEELRKLGAERLGLSSQIDYFCNPYDAKLADTDEILRIREENGRVMLTYKGPQTESRYRKRPKFEFEIDEETTKSFLAMYGDRVEKVVQKTRDFYQLDGLTFSVDKVSKREGGIETDLGNFVEVRLTGKRSNDDIKDILEKLGLSMSDGIKKTYFEM